MRVVRVLPLAALAAFAVAAAGCGSSSMLTKAEYEAEVAQARDRVDFALAQITVGQGTLEELLDRMEDGAVRIENAADDLGDAGSADGFEDETDGLVKAFHELAGGLEGTASDARQPELGNILTGTRGLEFPGWIKANRILVRLKQQGIQVEPIGSH